jgi:hypothetical protein
MLEMATQVSTKPDFNEDDGALHAVYLRKQRVCHSRDANAKHKVRGDACELAAELSRYSRGQ